MSLTPEKRQALDAIFKAQGYNDYQWIDPQKIIVAQWVRLKCQFGCGEYGRGGACPPNTPSVAECKQFFNEYTQAVIVHFEGKMDQPEDRHADDGEDGQEGIERPRANALRSFDSLRVEIGQRLGVVAQDFSRGPSSPLGFQHRPEVSATRRDHETEDEGEDGVEAVGNGGQKSRVAVVLV